LKQNPDLIRAISNYQDSLGEAHRWGTFIGGPLTTLKYYCEEYFCGKPIKSVETGCGASTILLSHFGEKHRVYCYDDRDQPNSSVDFAMGFPGFHKNNVDWVFGPTQTTLPSNPLTELVDLIIIDGPHGFPFAELEYYYFYPWLKPGGILIIDDIHIPTLHNLYRFLKEDDMFYLHNIVENTAFFQRSKAPALDPEGDDWWRQRYNMQRFPAIDHGRRPGHRAPFSLSFQGSLGRLQRNFERGFILLNGKPITEGPVSIMKLQIEPALSGLVTVDIDIECVAQDQRPNAGVELFLNFEPAGITSFDKGAPRQTVSNAINCSNTHEISIKLHNWGLKHAEKLEGYPSADFDLREPGIIVHGVEISAASKPNDRTPSQITVHDGSVVSFTHSDTPIRFFVDQPDDSIQGYHLAGRFYEEEELALISAYVKPNARMLDIGANVGNHTVYFEKILKASRVVAIEPVPRSIKVLMLNASLNDLTCVDVSRLGVALGDVHGYGAATIADPLNLGGAVIVPDETGSIEINRGDALLEGETFDFIKIDVESHEVEVLRGLEGLIRAANPTVFIEVWDNNVSRFDAVAEDFGYKRVDEYRRYEYMTNFMLQPTEV